jgi:hypothetical protein
MNAILVLFLLGFAAAQVPVPCVTPPQWEGRLFEVNEQQQYMVRGRLSYDSLYHRERFVDEVDAGGQESFYDTIALFDAQVEYVYDFRARNCTRRPLNRPWRDFGVRPNSTSFGEGYVGTSAVPGAGILVSLWYVLLSFLIFNTKLISIFSIGVIIIQDQPMTLFVVLEAGHI